MSYESRAEVAAKIDWEGGYDAVLEYGLRSDDLPEDDMELRNAWEDMVTFWREFQDRASYVAALLPESELT